VRIKEVGANSISPITSYSTTSGFFPLPTLQHLQ